MIIRPPQVQDFQKVREMLADAGLPTEDFAPEHLAFIADDDGTPVGAIGFERYEGVGLLRSLAVDDRRRRVFREAGIPSARTCRCTCGHSEYGGVFRAVSG